MISVQQLIGSSLRAVAAATSKNCIHHVRVHDRHLQCHSNRAVENPTVPGADDTVTQTITVVWTRSPNRPGIEHVADEFKDMFCWFYILRPILVCFLNHILSLRAVETIFLEPPHRGADSGQRIILTQTTFNFFNELLGDMLQNQNSPQWGPLYEPQTRRLIKIHQFSINSI